VTAEVPVATYPPGVGPDPALVAGVDLGIIHPYAVAGPVGQQLLVSGRVIRAGCRQHLRDRKGRSRAAARRAPKPGQRGSRRWRKHKRRQRQAGAHPPGVHPARRDPRRRPSSRPPVKGPWPAPARPHGESLRLPEITGGRSYAGAAADSSRAISSLLSWMNAASMFSSR
jgi:hypothetical protein